MVQSAVFPIDKHFGIWLISHMRLTFHEDLKKDNLRNMKKLNVLFTNFLKRRVADVSGFFQLWIIVP